MATARAAAWSFPPPTCTSWRVGSSPTTGPYRTSERSRWASASSPPPAWPGTVRPEPEHQRLHLSHRVWVSCLVWIPLIHILILGTYITRLNLYACRSQFVSVCVFFVPSPPFGCDDSTCRLSCQVSPTPTRTASGSWIAACQRPLKRRVTKRAKIFQSSIFKPSFYRRFSLFVSNSAFSSAVVDQQRRAQVGHRDPRGDLQHADAAGGVGGREGQAGPSTCQPDGSPDYGALTRFIPLQRLHVMPTVVF